MLYWNPVNLLQYCEFYRLVHGDWVRGLNVFILRFLSSSFLSYIFHDVYIDVVAYDVKVL